MVLEAEALRARLLRLEEVVSRLEELRAESPSEDFRAQWTIERGLHVAAEGAFDIGNHILSAHFGVSAASYEDILSRLATHGVVTPELRERLRGVGGFRDLLVHDYLRLDPDRVRERLPRAPEDFSEFGREVGRWLESI